MTDALLVLPGVAADIAEAAGNSLSAEIQQKRNDGALEAEERNTVKQLTETREVTRLKQEFERVGPTSARFETC